MLLITVMLFVTSAPGAGEREPGAELPDVGAHVRQLQAQGDPGRRRQSHHPPRQASDVAAQGRQASHQAAAAAPAARPALHRARRAERRRAGSRYVDR